MLSRPDGSLIRFSLLAALIVTTATVVGTGWSSLQQPSVIDIGDLPGDRHASKLVATSVDRLDEKVSLKRPPSRVMLAVVFGGVGALLVAGLSYGPGTFKARPTATSQRSPRRGRAPPHLI